MSSNSSKNKTRKNKSVDDFCRVCSVKVNDDDKALFCNFCEQWHCLSHTELDDNAYNLLSETTFDSILWKCSLCPSLELTLLANLTEKLSNFEEKINERMDKIETNVSKKINLAYKVKETAKQNDAQVSFADVGVNTSVNASSIGDELLEDNCEQGPTPEVLLNNNDYPHDNNRETIPPPICGHYKLGKCRHGISGKKLVNNMKCKYRHPKKCKLFCNFGRLGCDGSCGFLHPVLCRNSTKYRSCSTIGCTLVHLLGTQRHIDRGGRQHQPSDFERIPNSRRREHNYRHHNHMRTSMTHPNNLEDHFDYRDLNHNSETANFLYKENDFPPPHKVSEHKINEMATAMMEKMTSCMEQFVQQAVPKRLDHGMIQNEQQVMHHSNGYQENNRFVPNHQHPFPNQQRLRNEAKNFIMPNPGFAQ